MIQAVLFDLDGVLVDAREWHYEALNEALSIFGFSILREEHDSFYNGLPTFKKLGRLTEDKGLPQSLHEFIYELKQIYTSRYIVNHTRPDTVKMLMMQGLKNLGLKLALCSNCSVDTATTMLQKSLLLPYFDLVLTNADVPLNKPSPDIYLKALACLQLRPEEALAVEDSPHGIASARAAGIPVITVRSAAEVYLGIFKNHLPGVS